MLRSLRARQFDKGLTSPMTRWGLRIWSALATRPALYRFGTGLANIGLRVFARGRGRIAWAPLAGGWTRSRDLPQPEAGTFMQQYKKRR